MANIPDEKTRGKRFWKDLEQSISERPLCELDDREQRGEGYERFAGFCLARRVQGLLLQHGFQPLEIDFLRLAKGIHPLVQAHCEGFEADFTVEAMVDCWGKIAAPEG